MKTHIDILPREVTNDKFSVFGCGYRNKDGVAVLAAKPNQSQDIAYIGNYIRSDRAQWATNTLRSMLTTATKDELGDFKKLYFETATFNGIFSYRSARNLVTRSPFLVLDIDDRRGTICTEPTRRRPSSGDGIVLCVAQGTRCEMGCPAA